MLVMPQLHSTPPHCWIHVHRNIKTLEEQLRACKTQTKAAQKAANDGAAAAAKAEKAQMSNRADIVSMQLQVAMLAVLLVRNNCES